MPQQPNAISLMLCDQVLFEEDTQKPYLLGVFTGMPVEQFPAPPQPFDIFAALTDGLGDVSIKLRVVHLDTGEAIYTQNLAISFPDPLKVVNVRFRVRQLVFEMPGTYLFALLVDDREIAARRVRVYEGTTP